MKISEHFDIREFVDPETYAIRGDKSQELVDIRIVRCAELLRELTGKPVIINTWHVGKQYKESGLRLPTTSTGAKFSQHKFGRAIDVKVSGINAEEVRNIIRTNWKEFKEAGLTTIEKDTPTWVHMDCRFTGLDSLYEVSYK